MKNQWLTGCEVPRRARTARSTGCGHEQRILELTIKVELREKNPRLTTTDFHMCLRSGVSYRWEKRMKGWRYPQPSSRRLAIPSVLTLLAALSASPTRPDPTPEVFTSLISNLTSGLLSFKKKKKKSTRINKQKTIYYSGRLNKSYIPI